ncbi:mitotic fidelity of chromosome transmission- protein [Coemansia sp. Benny D115]|nr:mitotic fidelity of chromosome transmission- protein [Coemansia sp. Benny D115]
MNNRTNRRAKSPANRNKYTDLGVTGRKTGVRVAGSVPVDNDGLENVDEFYKQTSPSQEKPVKPAKSLQALLSPTPMRTVPNYDSMMGALDLTPEKQMDIIRSSEALRAEEVLASPTEARLARADRRRTMAVSKGADWINSPKKGRRVTMAFAAKNINPMNDDDEEDDELNFGPISATDQPADRLTEAYVERDVVGNGVSPSRKVKDAVLLVRETVEPKASELNGTTESDARENGNEQADVHEDNDAEDYRADDNIDANFEEGEGEDEGDRFVISESEAHDPHADTEPGSPHDAANEPAEPSPERPVSTAKSRKKKKAAAQESSPQPVRRSGRTSVAPLAFWRNEHVEYEYENEDGVPVPHMKNVVRVRHTAEEKKQAKRRRTKRTAALPSLRGIPRSELDLDDRGKFYYYDDENYGFPVKNDTKLLFGPRFKDIKHEPDMDDDDIPVDESPKPVVGRDGTTTEMREVAISRQSIVWTNEESRFTGYRMGVGLFLEEPDGSVGPSSGVLVVAVGGKKPARNSSYRMLFYLVISGQVEVTINGSAFKVGVMGQFLVPSYNTYSITNVGTHPAQLYYVHVCTSNPEPEPEAEPQPKPKPASSRSAKPSASANADADDAVSDSDID